MSDYRGRFLWHELMTTDVQAGIDFYTGLIGWTTQAWDGAGQPYTMWIAGETPVGGVMELPADAAAAGAPPHWLAYIGAPDLDATVARAGELGATIIVPTMEIPEVGRVTILSDPQGAVFAAYQPKNDPPPEAPPAEGRFSWHELITSDREAGWAFYSELFGWETVEEMDMGEGAGIYHVYGRPGGAALGGIMNRPPDAPPVSSWTLYARVPDCEAAVEAVTSAGGQILMGPMDVPGGDRIAQFLDPQGALFAVHEVVGADG